jgi:hypothetical protein
MNPAKKLKCAAPDLQVEVGEEKKVFEYHSLFLAYQSPYIDTMLAAPMKESETKRISFPEITPETWEKMMEYLEDGGRDMTFEDAEKVAPFYDKYQFEQGRSIVDKILEKEVSDASKAIKLWMKSKFKERVEGTVICYGENQHRLDWIIKRLLLSEKYKLEETKEACIESLASVMCDVKARLMIFVRHWIALAPFVVQDDRLWKDHVEVVLGDVGEANKERFVKASQEGESKTIFRLLRALLEKAYAQVKGVTFP